QFLVEHNLGIDCSGLATYIFQAIYQENKKIDIFKKIKIISFFKNPWRWVVAWLRPIENISVRVLANDKNSFLINDFQKIKPGDMLIRTNLRHIYLITEIEKTRDPLSIRFVYVHAPRPKQTNYFGPGVFQNTILLEKGNLSELSEKINDEVVVRRLKF
ncbi:hypothetical protein KKG58_03465, partial [Patescibacteria group bacterium]|nr:hypothetical protein [Patescibacteria group bacterium]